MRVNKKLVPNSRIKQKGAYDRKGIHREEDYLEMHNLGKEIVGVIIVLAIIAGIICGILAGIGHVSQNYRVYRHECDIVAGKNPHFFSNPPAECHVGPNWAAPTIPL